MKSKIKLRLVQDDRMCTVWRKPNGDCIAQGKRVPKDHPLTVAERRIYVGELARSAIMCKFLMESRGINLTQAWELLKEARRPAYRYHNGVPELLR